MYYAKQISQSFFGIMDIIFMRLSMERDLTDHEIHKIKVRRKGRDVDYGIWYEIRNDDMGDILATDEDGQFWLIQDNECNRYNYTFDDYDSAYESALKYEQTEQHRLTKEAQQQILKEVREKWRIKELQRQEFLKNNPSYADENNPSYAEQNKPPYADDFFM
ncbi:MAG: hypothetical protein WCD53_27230 [Microcoleus sp.]